jgi:hypothetical protein
MATMMQEVEQLKDKTLCATPDEGDNSSEKCEKSFRNNIKSKFNSFHNLSNFLQRLEYFVYMNVQLKTLQKFGLRSRTRSLKI